ncbi:MAG TPA: methyltransferase domain-containing protein [Croceibacterium sp.]|nr:methyltransferase domain-containing protein [Croceibacterium sp.]
MTVVAAADRFRADYAAHRASEGRAHKGAELRSLPYLRSGPLARQWAVRARSFEALMKIVVRPMAKRANGPVQMLDLGAGNGWLSYRLAREGHRCTAIDIREDDIDGLGAAEELRRIVHFARLTASFEALPLPDRSADLAVFNASLHYATDLPTAMAEAARCVRSGGCIAIVDSPFYGDSADGEAMVREKRLAPGLAALDCIEFLTRDRLEDASGIAWRRHRVRYPLWYELRPLMARLRGTRLPSRFDLWTAELP